MAAEWQDSSPTRSRPPLWPRLLKELADRLSPDTVETWFHPLTCAGEDDREVRLFAPGESFRAAFLQNYAVLVCDLLRQLSGRSVLLHVDVNPRQDRGVDSTLLPVVQLAQIPVDQHGTRWLIEGLWTDRAVGILGGPPKALKTFMALEMAVSVSSGTPCLGRFAVPTAGPVLIYAAEDPPAALRTRLESLAFNRALSPENLDIHLITADVLRLDRQPDQDRLEATVLRYRPALLVLDPLVRLHSQDENQSGPMAALLGYLRCLQRRAACAILVVHHVRKNTATATAGYSLRGSSDLYAWVDSFLCLQRHRHRITLSAEHRTAPPLPPIPIKLTSTDGNRGFCLQLPDEDETPEPSGTDRLQQTILKLLAPSPQPVSTEEIRERLGVRKQRVSGALRDLCNSGRVVHSREGYALGPAPRPQPALSEHSSSSAP